MIISNIFHLATPATAAAACLLLLAGHYEAYRLWRDWFTPREVALNDRDITANGSADDLRKGYHQRRSWVRFWWWLGLTLAGNLPLWFIRPTNLVFLVGCLALAVLLGTYFARYFSPLLSLARVASGRTDLSEWHASSDSASWPDAAVWKQMRSTRLVMQPDAERQEIANDLLQRLLTRTWLYGRWGYALLLVGAGVACLMSY